jgi:hypothetical protein
MKKNGKRQVQCRKTAFLLSCARMNGERWQEHADMLWFPDDDGLFLDGIPPRQGSETTPPPTSNIFGNESAASAAGADEKAPTARAMKRASRPKSAGRIAVKRLFLTWTRTPQKRSFSARIPVCKESMVGRTYEFTAAGETKRLECIKDENRYEY